MKLVSSCGVWQWQCRYPAKARALPQGGEHTVYLAQKTEKVKRDPEKGKADADSDAASCQKVSQHVSESKAQNGCCFPSAF